MPKTSEKIAPREIDLWLHGALGLKADETPFPWQTRLLHAFLEPKLEVRALDIPTGLGKTAVMAVWLVARALGAKALPRRLVYVVDRRAVVDQATEVAERLRRWVEKNPDVKRALELSGRSLPISTLRGQHVDNREWLEDPATPAIVVGTVDMVGSRVLFEGYGVSRKMRPYHAGLLGVDTLVALDEAHLVPPFERLLEAISDGGAVLGPQVDRASRVPPFRFLALSATGRARKAGSFLLDATDRKHPVVKKRLEATKRLRTVPLEGDLADALARQAWKTAGDGADPVRCLVFCNKRDDAVAVRDALDRLAKGDKKAGMAKVEIDRELFVGGRRVFERGATMDRLRAMGFLAGSEVRRAKPSFVIATSAGEVGVDLDADHMVCDLVAWERMVQRLGRVNRRGEGDAIVTVVMEPAKEPPKAVAEAMKRRDAGKYPNKGKEKADLAKIDEFESSQSEVAAWPKPFRELPKLERGECDASPAALTELKLRAAEDEKLARILDAATTRPPLRPAVTRALVDAWAMTSLDVHTGRPAVAPWLRGWIEEDAPQTSVVWRKFLPVRAKPPASQEEAAAFFEAAPPHASEVLETESYRVVEWLLERVERMSRQPAGVEGEKEESDACPINSDSHIAFVLDGAGEVSERLTRGDLLAATRETWTRKRLTRDLSGATIVVDRRLAGLFEGMLSKEADQPPETADGERWMEPAAGEPPPVRFRIREVAAPVEDDSGAARDWRARHRFVVQSDESGEIRWLVVEKWRHDAATEDDRSAGREQTLEEHQSWTERCARQLGTRLGLPNEFVEMLALAGRLHDEGKRAARWQRAASAREGGPYAKTRGPMRPRMLDGYRHEFGSIPFAEKDPVLRALPAELRDLALHLIASHHGFARPLLSTSGCEDAPSSALEERAREVALRFVRLQKVWGPWGLAWWEALLRSADQQASRENDEVGKRRTAEVR